MKEKKLGVRFLLEVGMSMVESIFPNIDINLYDQLTQVLETYLRGNTHFDLAKQVFMHILRRADSLQHIREIMILTDDPIPSNDDNYSDSEDLGHMRKKRSTWTNY